MTHVEIPVNALKLWFWMLEDSGEPKLEQQSEQALLSLFDDLETAKDYLQTRQVQ